MKSLCFFIIIFLISAISDARRFEVGGNGAWVPNPQENYQTWAEKSRFLVHDTLHFNYAKGSDSVLEVNKADFEGCNTKNPIKKMEDGASEISLDRSGPFYFISGNEDNCKKGQKLTVVVLSARTPSSTAPPPQAAAPGTSPPGILPSPSPGAHSPKSSSAPGTSPPGSMAPKSSSPASSPPAPPKSSSPVSPSSAPVTSPPGPMAPESSAPVTSPPGSMAPVEPPSSSSDSPSANSPSSFSPTESPSGSDMGPSGDAPSTSGDITTPSEAPGQKKSSANGIVVISVTTVLSLVLTILLSV